MCYPLSLFDLQCVTCNVITYWTISWVISRFCVRFRSTFIHKSAFIAITNCLAIQFYVQFPDNFVNVSWHSFVNSNDIIPHKRFIIHFYCVWCGIIFQYNCWRYSIIHIHQIEVKPFIYNSATNQTIVAKSFESMFCSFPLFLAFSRRPPKYTKKK